MLSVEPDVRVRILGPIFRSILFKFIQMSKFIRSIPSELVHVVGEGTWVLGGVVHVWELPV